MFSVHGFVEFTRVSYAVKEEQHKCFLLSEADVKQ